MQLLVARSGVMRPGASRDFCATAGAAKIQSAATSKNARMERKRWSEMTNAETASASALDRMLLLQAAPGKGAPENSDAPVDTGASRLERRGEAYRGVSRAHGYAPDARASGAGQVLCANGANTQAARCERAQNKVAAMREGGLKNHAASPALGVTFTKATPQCSAQ